jgi:hypothetical protein
MSFEWLCILLDLLPISMQWIAPDSIPDNWLNIL